LEIFAGEVHPNVIFKNFLNPVIKRWRARGLVMRENSLEIYIGEEYPKVIFTNFLKPVITTWRTRGLVVRENSLDNQFTVMNTRFDEESQ
jgi:hypothetical protein